MGNLPSVFISVALAVINAGLVVYGISTGAHWMAAFNAFLGLICIGFAIDNWRRA